MELDCFVHESWRPRIRPASPRREWMESSPERFAYRCLPLAIANAHGWEVLSPCGFAARWNGGMGVNDVEVRVDPGATPRQAPVSLFGQATVTFHVEGLIRTSPGWNLWVGGSPNAAKDGIAPLGAVIETDWSPYSFTMNWRFTRPNEWVRFEEDEPFCFFFPVQRGVLDGVTPAIRPLAEAPDLADAFARWSASRDAFQEHVRLTNPQAPADRWQKLYYRGVDPDGEPGADDHQSKLRVAAFRQPPGFAAACPVSGARAAAAPPPRIGPEAVSVPPPPEPASSAHAARALARRDWLLDVATRQRLLSPAASSVLRVRDLSAEDFLEEFYARSWPVVIEGELDDWPALRRWSPDYLRARLDEMSVEDRGERPNGADALAPLRGDLGRLDKYLMPDGGDIAVEPAGGFTPLRFDLANNMLAQIVGRRTLTLLPPSETSKLANHADVFSDVRDIADPERLALFPQARDARSIEVDLHPGDLLFLPVGWWRQARSPEFGAALTYTDFRWPNDAHATFPRD